MIKAKYTLGEISTTIEFETIEQLLKYERAQKDENYQSLPGSFDKDAFHKKVDSIKCARTEQMNEALSVTLSAKNIGANYIESIETQIEGLKEKARAIRKYLKRGGVPTKPIPDLTLYLINQITKLKP